VPEALSEVDFDPFLVGGLDVGVVFPAVGSEVGVPVRNSQVGGLANGELDVQVDAEQNLPAIRRALAKAGNQHVTIERLPHLNHLFQHAETGAVSEYATIEQTFDPAALKLVTEWVVDTVQGQ